MTATATEARLDTTIRPDQAMTLHKLKVFKGLEKQEVVQNALDSYFAAIKDSLNA